MRTAATDKEAEKRLRVDVLNEYAWEESVLFACERASQADGRAQAVAEAVLTTIEIDPMLAAEMIYRSNDAVWERIKSSIKKFLGRWYEKGKVDRAVRFMITTGEVILQRRFGNWYRPLAIKFIWRHFVLRAAFDHRFWEEKLKIGSRSSPRNTARCSAGEAISRSNCRRTDAHGPTGNAATNGRCPMRGENYYRAEIVAGRVGQDQAAPLREF